MLPSDVHQNFFPFFFSEEVHALTRPQTPTHAGSEPPATLPKPRLPVPDYTPHCAVAAGRGKTVTTHPCLRDIHTGLDRGFRPGCRQGYRQPPCHQLGCAGMRGTQGFRAQVEAAWPPSHRRDQLGCRPRGRLLPEARRAPLPDGGRSLEGLLGDPVRRLAALAVGRSPYL